MANQPDRIIWHHTASTMPGHQAGAVNQWHKARAFPLSSLGFYGGYHWLIERDGSLFQYRQENEEGAHTIGFNYSSIGVCMAGNFDIQTPSPQQAAAFAQLLSDIMTRWNIPIGHIDPHRKYANKSCPGSSLSDNWAILQVAPLRLSFLQRWFAAILKSLTQ